MPGGNVTTMLVVASNYGLANTVYAQTESTEAGGLRLFEFRADRLSEPMSTRDADDIRKTIENNHGNAGMLYAEYLAKNRTAIKQVLKIVGDELQAKHKFQSKERFWYTTMTALVAGATLAKQCRLYDFESG